MSSDTLEQTTPSAAVIIERMASESGPTYWRSLGELAGTQAVDELVHREFPSESHKILNAVDRRSFFKVMGASMMLAGLTSCARQPDELIVPYVKPPEELVSGRPQYYATAMPRAGYAMGLVATCFEGRPTKMEGLKEHPASLGATDVFAQASVLDLYDPARQDTITYAGHISTWQKFVAELHKALQPLDSSGGDGLRILTGAVTSPTLEAQLRAVQALYPKAQWHQFEPGGVNNAQLGAQMAFGEAVDTVYDFSAAEVVLSLDADFLLEGPAHVRHAHDFAQARDYDNNGHRVVRLYAAESSPALTGANADHRIGLRYPDIETLARLVAAGLGISNAAPNPAAVSAIPEKWVKALIADLQAAAGKSIVIAGAQQPPVVHALAHSMNERLGNAGKTVQHIPAVEQRIEDNYASLARLAKDLKEGKVQALLILGGNPVHTAPGDLEFAKALEQCPFTVHLTTHGNETSFRSHWVIPEAHYLEAWGDARAYDGTVSIIQPVIQPLYNGKTAAQVLAAVAGDDAADSLGLVKATWQQARGTDNFDAWWKTVLSQGIVSGTAHSPKTVKARNEFPAHAPAAQSGLDAVFRLDPCIFDGRYADNGWLQELPKPLSKLTWDNAVFMSPQTARALHLEQQDEVEVHCNGRKVKGAVMLSFGHPQNAVTLHLGYGREIAGYIGKGRGFNAAAVQNSESPWFATGVDIKRLGRTYLLAHTEEHWHVEQSRIQQGQKAQDRHLIREATLDFAKEHPAFAQQMTHPEPARDFTLYEPDEKLYTRPVGYAWGMTIDLNKCTGCNVCITACQAENNIPIVGKDQVDRGREMHWIRVDRYYRLDGASTIGDNPYIAHQPVPCMQCENAPCEPVCPVGATMHSSEGLNDMVYNRCVGTRYCLNNCPYKVRRFNFFHYNIREGQDAVSLKMVRNPNVTVRSRGVMEKCTYCVQRINIARIDAKVRDSRLPEAQRRGIVDGDIATACEAACPSRAITFGNINEADSRVAKLKANPRNYALIGDVGTRPRTTYLARIRNQNPGLGTIKNPHLHVHGGDGHGDAHGNDHHAAATAPVAENHTRS